MQDAANEETAKRSGPVTPGTSLVAGGVPPEVVSRCLRWRNGRASYRPPGEVFDPTHYAVEPIEERVAKDFIERHHRQLVELGAPPYRAGEGNEAYVRRALLEGGFRKIRHPGNLAFV